MDCFAERIKILRLEKKLTQIEFAKKLNMSNGTIGSWETGAVLPSVSVLIKIADFFEVSTDYLLGRTDY